MSARSTSTAAIVASIAIVMPIVASTVAPIVAIGCGGRGAAESAAARKMRGVSWEAGREVGSAELEALVDLGADWISQTPFGWCASNTDPEIRVATEGRVLWGETDAGLAKTAEIARSFGIRTLLKPHLWVRGAWCGTIAMQSEEDWAKWFDAYERFIVHYAELARDQRMEAFAVGTELEGTTEHADRWRAIIARVRAVYPGRITYCANWSGEAERLSFWDALDFIGVQAYYPLASSGADQPSDEEIARAWKPVNERLAALSRRWTKEIVFTEVGYRSAVGALVEPWKYGDHAPPDLEVQARAYRALFEAAWPEEWLAGIFLWKWRPRPRAPAENADFSPQGKPAHDVIRSHFRAAARADETHGDAR